MRSASRLFFSPVGSPDLLSFFIECCLTRESEDISLDEPLDFFTVIIEKEKRRVRLKKRIALITYELHFFEWDIRKWDEYRTGIFFEKCDECINSFPTEYDELPIEPCRIGYTIEWSDDKRE